MQYRVHLLVDRQHEKPLRFRGGAVDQHAHHAQKKNGKQQYGDQQDQQNAPDDAEDPTGCAAFTHGFILALSSNKNTKLVYTRKPPFDKFLNTIIINDFQTYRRKSRPSGSLKRQTHAFLQRLLRKHNTSRYEV